MCERSRRGFVSACKIGQTHVAKIAGIQALVNIIAGVAGGVGIVYDSQKNIIRPGSINFTIGTKLHGPP